MGCLHAQKAAPRDVHRSFDYDPLDHVRKLGRRNTVRQRDKSGIKNREFLGLMLSTVLLPGPRLAILSGHTNSGNGGESSPPGFE